MGFANNLGPQIPSLLFPPGYLPFAYLPAYIPVGGEGETPPPDPDPGTDPGPGWVPLPAPPDGLIPVFWRPSFLGQPVDARASLYYVDDDRPYSRGSAELTRRRAEFEKKPQVEGEVLNAYNVYRAVFLPPDLDGTPPVAYQTFCEDANLLDDINSRWEMIPTTPEKPYHYEDELRAVYQAKVAMIEKLVALTTQQRSELTLQGAEAYVLPYPHIAERWADLQSQSLTPFEALSRLYYIEATP